ncbi:MAG: radical SAM protein [Clostridiales bacterium]|nr:radical SAM protein [Clostridiales bacterium]
MQESFSITTELFTHCELCPRRCGVNRYRTHGYCGCGTTLTAARAALHHWEEPCISGTRGSGAVFFTGCTLRCRFCQNQSISQDGFGKSLSVSKLADIFLRLQEEGAHNINLVTATQYLPLILPALDLVRNRLHIPVVYNCGGYERVETVRALQDYVDIWLPDLKYYDPGLSESFSGAPHYFAIASEAILQMIRQTGAPAFQLSPDSDIPIMTRGVIIRHLVLPGHYKDSLWILAWMQGHLPENQYLISLMSQYTPYHTDPLYPELNRRITTYEYEKVVDAALALGLDAGFMQKKSSAKEEYTPPFDLEGL